MMTQAPAYPHYGSAALPALFSPNSDTGKRFIEFFTANIRNPNTRKAYAWAVGHAHDAGG